MIKGTARRSAIPPKNEALPLGTKRPRASATRTARKGIKKGLSMAERLAALPDVEPEARRMLNQAIGVSSNGGASGEAQKEVDIDTAGEVRSLQRSEQDGNETSSQPAEPAKEKKMTLQFKSLSRNGRNAFYTGAAVTIRIPVAAFPDKQHVESIEVADGVFRPAKRKLTKEERAALPKPTLAEKIARQEKALARNKEKLASEQSASL